LPGTLQADGITAWFNAFTQHSVVLHSLSYNAEVHRMMTTNSSSAIRQRRILIHKGRTIAAVNAALGTVGSLSNHEIEALMIAVFILWRANPGELNTEADYSLFRPYMPGVGWVNVYSKADAVDAHAKALLWLLGLIGGMDKVQLPGLRVVLAT
jgi:hypothetical protein